MDSDLLHNLYLKLGTTVYMKIKSNVDLYLVHNVYILQTICFRYV